MQCEIAGVIVAEKIDFVPEVGGDTAGEPFRLNLLAASVKAEPLVVMVFRFGRTAALAVPELQMRRIGLNCLPEVRDGVGAVQLRKHGIGGIGENVTLLPQPQFQALNRTQGVGKSSGNDFRSGGGAANHCGGDANQLHVFFQRRFARPPELAVIRFVPDFKMGDPVAIPAHDRPDEIFPRTYGRIPVTYWWAAYCGGVPGVRRVQRVAER